MRNFLTALCLAAFCVTLFWLAQAKWPLGVAGEWQIKPNAGAWPLPAWGLPIATLLIFGGLAAVSAYDRFKRAKSDKEKLGSTRLCVFALTVVAFAWPWALLGPGATSNLIASQWSDISNEYFGTSYSVTDARTFTREYATRWQTPQSAVQAHTATHPPGAVLFYYYANRLYDASPFLQSSFSGIAASLTNESVEALATNSNRLRASAERSAGVKNPDPPLPTSAVGAAVWCAFLISLLLASCVPATYLIASIAPRAGLRESGAEPISIPSEIEPQATPESVISATTPETTTSESATSESVTPAPVPAASAPDSTPDANEARGMTAAALLALAPVLSLFAFSLDAIIACGAAWTMAFIALRLRGGKPFWLVAAGAMMALTSFISFGALAIAAIAMTALFFAKRSAAAKEIGLFLAGFAALWLALVLIFPMQPLEIFRNAMAAHRFATVETRSRGAWLWMNIVSYAVFCGWPLFLAACAGGAGFIRDFLRHRFSSRALASTPVIIGVAALLTMLLLTLSGGAKGEVERLWLFLTPSLAALAAATLMQRAGWRNIGVLLLLQAAQTIIMAAWLAPLVLPL